MYMIEEENVETMEELQEVVIKDEGDTEDGISYEPLYFDAEEVSQDTDDPSNIQSDYQMEVVVDNTKENHDVHLASRRNLKVALHTMKKKIIKQETEDFVVVELDNKQRVFQCEVCSKTFKDRSKLKVHREIHTTERNVICLVSNKRMH